jgi:type II secretory pathway pseudopilin PulG
LKTLLRLLLALVILGLAAWAALALYFGPPASALGAAVVAAAGLAAAIAAARRRGRRWPVALFAVVFAGFLFVWSQVTPSNDRNWQPDVARLPYATFDGDLVTVHDIRNFDYRTETDYTPHYYDKTYDLRELDSFDLISVYWAGDAIAHIMVSFGFAGRDYLAVSIETRKEVGESYDTIRGFFRQYELTYIVADERDLIRLRTNYRKDPPEQVYVYRAVAPKENGRRLFLDYLREVNQLREKPEFYNTLTTNCTTNVLRHTRVNPGDHAYSWKILLSGYAAEYAYERGRLDTSLPFAELKRRSLVNAAAQAADQASDFSQRIRADLPRPPAPQAGLDTRIR